MSVNMIVKEEKKFFLDLKSKSIEVDIINISGISV